MLEICSFVFESANQFAVNRLGDLLGNEESLSRQEVSDFVVDPESQGQPISSEGFDPAFLELKNSAQECLSRLQANLGEVEALATELDASTTASEEAGVLQRYEAALSRASQSLALAKASLDAMARANLDFANEHDDDKPAEVSFRKTVHGSFGRELASLLMRLESLRKRFEAQAQKKHSVRKMAQSEEGKDGLTGTNADASQTTRANDSDVFGADQQQGTMFGGDYQNQAAAYFEIDYQENDRLMDLQRIESAMRDIRSIFVSLSETIDRQGQVVDSIEFSVVNAKNYTHKAQIQLINARRKQRRRTAAYACCFIVIAVVVVLIILFFVKNIQPVG